MAYKKLTGNLGVDAGFMAVVNLTQMEKKGYNVNYSNAVKLGLTTNVEEAGKQEFEVFVKGTWTEKGSTLGVFVIQAEKDDAIYIGDPCYVIEDTKEDADCWGRFLDDEVWGGDNKYISEEIDTGGDGYFAVTVTKKSS